jgi:hypothetical protein
VAAVRELSRGAADDVVIEIAVRENRILLTKTRILDSWFTRKRQIPLV